jgi:predicted extracellular nuclease
VVSFPSGTAFAEEITDLVGSEKQLTVATFNVLNLDPKREDIEKVDNRSRRNVDDDVADGQFAGIAGAIVTNLRSPDIIALQEVQDNDGAEMTTVVDARETGKTLIEAIASAGGPRYIYRDISPRDDSDGGQDGGNIRVAYLYNPDRVKLNRLTRFPDDVAFRNSRKPLVGQFTFQNIRLIVINNHLTSQIGGASADRRREKQAVLVNRFVTDRLAGDRNANIIVLGDFNDVPDSPTLRAIEGSVLQNLAARIPEDDRYSYIFDDDRQLIDQILVSSNLATKTRPEADAVHVNAGRKNAPSDHDPVIARFTIEE